MRDILFRGKAINRDIGFPRRTNYRNGDWVLGLVSEANMYGVEMTNQNGVSGIEVDRSTIGEYTGLCDANGTKIFEGDIIKLYPPKDDCKEIFIPTPRNPKDERILEVVFYKGTFAVDMRKWVKHGSGRCALNGYETERLVVIGNIYDNPDLLRHQQ